MDRFSHTVRFNNQVRDNLFDPSIINKFAVGFTLLFIFLVSWGDSIWDGLPRVVATIAFGFALIQLLIHGTHRHFVYFHLLALLYFAWQLVSMMWSPDPEWALGVAQTTTQLLFLVLLFSLVIDNNSRLIWAYQVYVFGNIAGSLVVISNYLQGITSGYLRYGIENLTIDSVGVFLAISIPMAVFLAKSSTYKWLRLLNLVSIPFIFYAIFLTATRTAFIAGIIGVFYWLYTHRKASFRVKASIAIVFILSIVTIFSFAPKSSVERVFSAGESITKGTLNSRSVIWTGAIDQWRESPIIGVGLGGLGHALSNRHINYRGAHNSFIHVMTETGIIGLLLFLGVHIALLIYILHAPSEDKVFMLALFFAMVISQLATHLQTEKITWFVYTLLAIHAQKVAIKRDIH